MVFSRAHHNMAPNMVKELTATSKKTSGEAMGLMVSLEMRSLQEQPYCERYSVSEEQNGSGGSR
jgi:hypothetical protein